MHFPLLLAFTALPLLASSTPEPQSLLPRNNNHHRHLQNLPRNRRLRLLRSLPARKPNRQPPRPKTKIPPRPPLQHHLRRRVFHPPNRDRVLFHLRQRLHEHNRAQVPRLPIRNTNLRLGRKRQRTSLRRAASSELRRQDVLWQCVERAGVHEDE
jgi:hypothetical protein